MVQDRRKCRTPHAVRRHCEESFENKNRQSPIQTYSSVYPRSSEVFIITPYRSSPTENRLSTPPGHEVKFRPHLPNPMTWARIWKSGVSNSSVLRLVMPTCKLQDLSTTTWQDAFAGRINDLLFYLKLDGCPVPMISCNSVLLVYPDYSLLLHKL